MAETSTSKDLHTGQFDCFVSYCQGDLTFVMEIVEELEREHDLKICAKPQDLLIMSENKIQADVILNRCSKLLLIISPAYLQSREWDFVYKVILCLSSDSRSHVILPLQYKPVQVPAILDHVTKVEYTKLGISSWVHMNLKASIKAKQNQPGYKCTQYEMDRLSQLKMDVDRKKDEKDLVDQNDSFTKDDSSNYDCLVSCCQDDSQFLTEMVKLLQDVHGLKVCTVTQDLLKDHNKLTTEVLTKRYKTIILVISPAYLITDECEFYCNLAMSLPLARRRNVVIPVLYKACNVPATLNHLTIVDYTQKMYAPWFWKRLVATITYSGAFRT